jgi:hypothetical protein
VPYWTLRWVNNDLGKREEEYKNAHILRQFWKTIDGKLRIGKAA